MDVVVVSKSPGKGNVGDVAFVGAVSMWTSRNTPVVGVRVAAHPTAAQPSMVTYASTVGVRLPGTAVKQDVAVPPVMFVPTTESEKYGSTTPDGGPTEVSRSTAISAPHRATALPS